MEAFPDRDTVNIRISDDQIQRTIYPHYTKRTISSGQFLHGNHSEKERLLSNLHHNNSENYIAIDGVGQIIQNRTKPEVVSHQPQKQTSLLSHSRLVIPTKSDVSVSLTSDVTPLVIVEMNDSSEEEFDNTSLRRFPKRDITRQLLQDGYDLDLQPDDSNLDLIPPKSQRNHCDCCSSQFGCGIQ